MRIIIQFLFVNTFPDWNFFDLRLWFLLLVRRLWYGLFGLWNFKFKVVDLWILIIDMKFRILVPLLVHFLNVKNFINFIQSILFFLLIRHLGRTKVFALVLLILRIFLYLLIVGRSDLIQINFIRLYVETLFIVCVKIIWNVIDSLLCFLNWKFFKFSILLCNTK